MAAGRRGWVGQWLKRWVANPIASLVLMLLLVGDAFTLPRGWDPTVVGRVVRDGLFPGTRYNPSNPHTVFVVDEPAGMRVIDQDSESWDELADMMGGDGPSVVRCECFSGTDRQGIWSHVYESQYVGIRITPLVGEWADEEFDEARRVLFSEQTRSLLCWWWLDSYQVVAKADASSGRVLWTGVAHDAFALTTFVALLYSFTTWPAWFAARPWSRQTRRLAKGLCSSCGYDARGLNTCPECGETVETGA